MANEERSAYGRHRNGSASSETALLADNLTNAMRDNSRTMLHELFRQSAMALGPGVVYVSKAEQYQL
ncbi:hypothetical protein FHS42_000794 [Streptomyces zagrosensis]|uniref:Uncharacterized protein n=1 Tax=Streptomyces zagrosensis TaxID=1042984 RepID=A0A7W9UWH0_9ACTN|nr:hypothetical protein [Streptomyces zagrosensis]